MDLTSFLDDTDTDEQNLTSAILDSNNVLTIDIENGDSVTVDLSSFLDDTDTDEQDLTSAVLDSNNVFLKLSPCGKKMY